MIEILLAYIFKKLNDPGDGSGDGSGDGPGLDINPGRFHKLMASDGIKNDYFGQSVVVSTDGLTIVIGSYESDAKGTGSGSTYVFKKQANGSYLLAQKLTALDGEPGDQFGKSLAVTADGLAIVVGSPGNDDKGTNSGSAYIFTKQPDGSYTQLQKLLASDGATGDNFGNSVAISGDGSTVVVGAFWVDDKGTDSGSAYIFTKQANGSYLQIQKLTASDGAAGDLFGCSVAVTRDGSIIIIGAYANDDKGDNSGSAYIFTRQTNGSYLETQKLISDDEAAGDIFGLSVAISEDGSTVVVSSQFDDDKGTDSGSAYVFAKEVDGSYFETHKLVASDGLAGDRFGIKVAVSKDGSTVIVGAIFDDDKGIDSGSAYIFTKQPDGSYLQTHKLIAFDGAAGDQFGISVAISNTSVVIGSQNNLTRGAAYVFY